MHNVSKVAPVRSAEYYYRNVTFQVHCFFVSPVQQSNTTLNHQQVLANRSDVFRSMFELPQGSLEPEGQSDSTPVVLESVRKQDFECLLDFLFGPVQYVSLFPLYSPSEVLNSCL
jgi:hypothetical protein